MKKTIFIAVLLTTAISTNVWGLLTQIIYTSEDLGGDRWQYSYTISNINLSEPIEEFTIYFDYGLYDNLTIETGQPLSDDWDEIVMQPDPVLADGGIYDALAINTGINQSQSVSGFSVSFDWLGTGEPAEQFYEIIDPVSFETIDSGFTVPEPTAMCLLATGCLILLKNRNKSI